LRNGKFKNIWIQPAAGDSGGSLGAALGLWHIELKKNRTINAKDDMSGSYLGPECSQDEVEKKLKELGVEDVLINFKGLTPGMLVTLGEKKIKTLKDFADLSTDELIGGYDEKQGKRFKIEGFLEEFALAKNEADDLIMNARNIVFK